jgi:hypothetical protein
MVPNSRSDDEKIVELAKVLHAADRCLIRAWLPWNELTQSTRNDLLRRADNLRAHFFGKTAEQADVIFRRLGETIRDERTRP